MITSRVSLTFRMREMNSLLIFVALSKVGVMEITPCSSDSSIRVRRKLARFVLCSEQNWSSFWARPLSIFVDITTTSVRGILVYLGIPVLFKVYSGILDVY